uniref:Conserved oligomeric Golgi complex subunit 1 n=1 Tax=Ciona savignyi TaxID=51511 RepID=H2Z1D8_CIOSA
VFERNNVEEIRELEKKTRHEIELKKEELRQMVGERYRDLLEAADKITGMKKYSEIVTSTIKDIQEYKSKRTLSVPKLRASQLSVKNENRFLELAAETKVLMEMPEEIWLQVEAGNMITASFLYLQSLQVLKNLSLEGNHSYSPILQWIPMLGQQAQAVGNLRSAILKQCNTRIADHALDLQSISEALCSIVLLEDVSIRCVLTKLLEARRYAIREILTATKTKSGYNHGMGTKGKICASLDILVKTTSQVFELFCSHPQSKGVVETMLQKCTQEPDNSDNCTKIWSNCVPKNLALQKVKFNITDFTIPEEIIQQLNTEWLTGCKSDLTEGIADLLKFTNSAKDLTNVRIAVMDILDQNNENDAIPTKTKWQNTCQAVFKQEVIVWNEILEPLFLNKMKLVVSNTFDELLSESKVMLEQQHHGKGTSISTFLWQEHENDIPSTMAWQGWQHRKTLSENPGLTLKSLAITPNVHQLCELLNKTVRKLLDDVNNYMLSVVAKDKTDLSYKRTASETKVETNQECLTVFSYLKQSSGNFFDSLSQLLSSLEQQLKSKVSKTDYSANEPVLSKALFLSQVCRNFFKLCHTFKECYVTNYTTNQPVRRHLSESHSAGDVKTTTDSSAWDDVVHSMSQQSLNLMTLCCNAILYPAIAAYKVSLLDSASGANILLSLSQWDCITVEEESESGNTVKSKIRVPASTMSFTQELLFTVCTEIEKIGGYSISRLTLRNLSSRCLQSILEAFSAAKNAFARDDSSLHGQNISDDDTRSPSQVWALQCLFDLRYLHHLLYQPADALPNEEAEDHENSFTYTELVDWLEGYIDPFDLDVFSPHITNNIQLYAARTSTLFGILVVSNKSTSSQKLFSSKDSHNVLPLM